MPNSKLTVKLAVLIVVSLASTELVAQPAFSQSGRFPTTENQQTKLFASTPSSEHMAAAIQLYRSLELSLNEIYITAAKEATTSAAVDFKAKTGRDLTEGESLQLLGFWYRKVEEIFTQENLEEAIATVYTNHFTLEELTAANQSADSLAQMESPALAQEIESAVFSIANRFLTDESWMNNMIQKVFEELPFMRDYEETIWELESI